MSLPNQLFWTPIYSTWSAYSFEQNDFILMTVLRGRPLGRTFALSLQKHMLPDPIWVTITMMMMMMMMMTMWRNQNKG